MTTYIITTILLFNLFFIQNTVLGVVFSVFYFLLLSRKLSKKFNPRVNQIFSMLLIISIILVTGSIFLFLYKLNNITIAITLITPLLFILKTKKISWEQKIADYYKWSIKIPLLQKKYKQFLVLLYMTIIAVMTKMLFSAQSIDAIRSPWKVVPIEFLTYYFIATIILVLITTTSSKKIYLSLISIHFFISSSIALVIYEIGYGFDQFIHQAAEKIIFENGAIYPKTIYYLGEYSLINILAKISGIEYLLIDKFLTILFFSIFIPIISYLSFEKLCAKYNKPPITIALLLLIFPFSHFIVTTPQNLANLFILFVIFVSMPYVITKKGLLIPSIMLSMATMAIHPLAGIPVIIFISSILIINYINNNDLSRKIKKIITIISLFIGSTIVPIIFLLNSYISGLSVNISLTNKEVFLNSIYSLKPNFVNNFNIIFDFIYFYKFNFYLILFLLLSSLFIQNKNIIKKFLPYLISFILLFINFLILKFIISFNFLIDYEQNNYTNRVFEISFFFLYPIIIFYIIELIKKIVQQKTHIKIFSVFFISLLITASLYTSYPRSDDYETSHSFNTTNSDITAVNWIDMDAKDNDFIVLSNQQVSAASIKEFGFKKYFENQFYYAIPTSSQLYKYYLLMVNDGPKKEYMIDAMNSVGVRRGYFIINSYWWKANDIIEEAKKTSTSYKEIDDGKIFIFKYIKK